MIVSGRGTLGEFTYGQALVGKTIRPVLDALALEHHTCTRLDELDFIADCAILRAIATQASVALILSSLPNGGKVSRRHDEPCEYQLVGRQHASDEPL